MNVRICAMFVSYYFLFLVLRYASLVYELVQIQGKKSGPLIPIGNECRGQFALMHGVKASGHSDTFTDY